MSPGYVSINTACVAFVFEYMCCLYHKSSVMHRAHVDFFGCRRAYSCFLFARVAFLSFSLFCFVEEEGVYAVA